MKSVQRLVVIRGIGRGLGPQQVSHRPHQHRPRGIPRGAHLFQPGVFHRRQLGVGSDFRHQIVIVRVEPLGHLQSGFVVHSACQGELTIHVQRAVSRHQVAEALGDCAQSASQSQDLVIEHEICRL